MKKNIKLVLVFILGIFSAIGLTVVATNINGKNINFRATDWNVKNVEEAVDYLKDRNKCVGIYSTIANVISGDKNTVGSIVRIGNEDFYVIGQGTGKESGKTKLLAKYLIDSNNNQTSGAGAVTTFSSSAYWSDKVGEGLQYPGSYNGSPKPFVYDENSNVYSAVNNYKTKLANLGLVGVRARLMNYEEATQLSYSIRKAGSGYRYWLGSAYSNSGIYYVTKEGSVVQEEPSERINGSYWGSRYIRPVILISTNKIGNAV